MWKFRLCCNHRAYSDKTLAMRPVCWEKMRTSKKVYMVNVMEIKWENNDTKNFTWKPF